MKFYYFLNFKFRKWILGERYYCFKNKYYKFYYWNKKRVLEKYLENFNYNLKLKEEMRKLCQK